MVDILRQLPLSFYEDTISRLVTQRNKCLKSDGELHLNKVRILLQITLARFHMTPPCSLRIMLYAAVGPQFVEMRCCVSRSKEISF
jgi:hypothetical protein